MGGGGYITHNIHKTLQCFGCILLTYVNNVCLIHLTTINHKRCFSNPTVLDSVVPRLTDWLLNHCQTLAHLASPQNNPHGAIGPQAHTFWLGDSHSLFYQSWLDPVQIKIAKYMWTYIFHQDPFKINVLFLIVAKVERSWYQLIHMNHMNGLLNDCPMFYLSNEVFAGLAFTFPTFGVLYAEVSGVWAPIYSISSCTPSPTS